MIDYARMQRESPRQKAALTRAKKKTDPLERLEAVTATCEKTVEAWNEIGAWPDHWAHWRVALQDAWSFAVLRLDEEIPLELVERVEALERAGL